MQEDEIYCSPPPEKSERMGKGVRITGGRSSDRASDSTPKSSCWEHGLTDVVESVGVGLSL